MIKEAAFPRTSSSETLSIAHADLLQYMNFPTFLSYTPASSIANIANPISFIS
jgi:hypothetical protein